MKTKFTHFFVRPSQKRILLFFCLFLVTINLFGQEPFKAKHSLVLYPFHSSQFYDFRDKKPYYYLSTFAVEYNFMQRNFNPVLGIGYNFQFRPSWAWDSRILVNSNEGFINRFATFLKAFSVQTKLGLQHFYLNRKWQLNVGLYLRLAHQKFRFYDGVGETDFVLKEKAIGLELGAGFAYRFTEQAKVVFNTAFRTEAVWGRRGRGWEGHGVNGFIPFESLSFAYTF